VSTIGDCWKLQNLQCAERKAVVVIGYEHAHPKVDLTPLIECFEAIAKHVAKINLSARVETRRDPENTVEERPFEGRVKASR
jgi:hypothetical protein